MSLDRLSRLLLRADPTPLHPASLIVGKSNVSIIECACAALAICSAYSPVLEVFSYCNRWLM
jgi:hypothetical protein